ncbi:MAG: hypothetical protein HY674_16525 [Chloroflexi bacterium]|nr:hypothetical protein [Chloroflexota bacterium]
MNPPDSTPQRPRDIVDHVEDLCRQKGSAAEVSPEYYESFIDLREAEIEVLARAALNAQANEARRLTFAKPTAEAPVRLFRLATTTLSVIAIVLARFDQAAHFVVRKCVGLEPTPDDHHAWTRKIVRARQIIEGVVRDFIQQQRDDGQEASSSATRQSPAQPGRHGWQTSCDPEVESARIWQLQLSLFPITPREFCERMGLNWLAACQLHADGWLSFDPRSVGTLNEAQEAELQFVGPLVAAGCDAELLARLLHGLRRPYQYRPGSIYLDWAAACWRLLPVAEQPNPPQVLADWLDSLKESGDRRQLEDIASDVASALKSLPQEEPEPE